MSAHWLALTALVVTASPAAPQAVRGSAVSTARFVELRPFESDTIDPALAGDSINCPPGPRCVVLRPGATEQSVAFTQDLRLTAWGFGLTGLSATAFLRIRAHSGDLVWPRADDVFDALIAYVEYDRDPVRVRAGRQATLGGLGFSSHDGVSALFTHSPRFRAEAYVGRSLARGLAEPRADALRTFENLFPDESVIILGGAAGVELRPGVGLTARYQREILGDRSGLVSERASVEAAVSSFTSVQLSATADWDFAFGQFGKADLRAAFPVTGRIRAETTLRRYVPYFELWTIWGFFSPVAWHEAEGRLLWGNATDRLNASLAGSIRRYDETGTGILGPALERHTRRVVAGAGWRLDDAWRFDADWTLETGFGASIGGGELAARWSPLPRTSVNAFATLFDQIDEFRIGEGRVVGGGLSAAMPLGDRVALDAGFSIYRHTSDRADHPDWSQRRAWFSARFALGSDPGLTGSRTP